MAARALSKAERLEATKVFQTTVPLDKVALTGSLGIGDRPYTLPNPWPWDWESWDINWGTDSYWQQRMAKHGAIDYWQTLMHELTHVWQGHNGAFPVGYVFNSVWHQIVDSDAYAYTPGQSWGSYNVEQQASIVEDWYANGCRRDDARFPYIRDHVWRRRP